MYVNIHRDDPREYRILFMSGVAFAVVVAMLIGLSIAIYTKVFDHVTTVTLQTTRAGEQLPKFGDVRYHGVLVGQIRHISQSGDKAIIELGLRPDAARSMPRELEASILPTTLFGQKYVALSAAGHDTSTGVENGTVIPADRVHTSVELSKVLSRLFPLLRAVRPVDLNTTLSALATALNGRGEAIGESLENLDAYLTAMRPHYPQLQHDLQLLATVAHAYDVAAPDFVGLLANLTVTARTISEKKDSLKGIFGDLTDVANVGSEILEDNETNIVRIGDLSVPVTALLDKYSPEYNCLLRGIARYKPVLEKTFEGGLVKQYIEFPAAQVRAYDQRDLAVYADKRGPRCLGLPDHPPMPWPGYPTDNGTNLDTMAGRGTSFGYVSNRSAADRASLRMATALLSQRTGQPAGSVPTLSALLYSPMVDGGEAAS